MLSLTHYAISPSPSHHLYIIHLINLLQVDSKGRKTRRQNKSEAVLFAISSNPYVDIVDITYLFTHLQYT